MVRTRSCTSGRHSRPPRHLIAVQGGESPRFLELVRCPVAATNGTASRSVSPSHAWPSGAPLRLGKRVSCNHVQQPPRGHRRARPRCLNPHECDGMAYRHYFASARIASKSRGPAAPTLVPLRECPGEGVNFRGYCFAVESGIQSRRGGALRSLRTGIRQ
jgi:hypothetical protein